MFNIKGNVLVFLSTFQSVSVETFPQHRLTKKSYSGWSKVFPVAIWKGSQPTFDEK